MDWQRLQKALALEAEHGFCNLQGRQARFAEFVSEVLHDSPPEKVQGHDRRKWQELGARYGDYEQLAAGARAHLVQDTRRWLYQLRRSLEPPAEPRIPPVTELDKGIQYLKGVGPIVAEKLARLGLLTVRDLLLYLPYEHISPAVQVLIKDLEVGERATVIATVKACNCFTSPKNQSLTILDLKVSDRSGWLKVSRFFAGRQFTNRGWQEKIKRQYQRGATIAISGQVRQSRYGITIGDPELEVLSESDSYRGGQILAKYALSDGIEIDLVRRAIASALPYAAALAEPLPENLRQQFDLMPYATAIQAIHLPPDADTLALARRRLVFDEFFDVQLGLLQRRNQYRARAATAPRYEPQAGSLLEQFFSLLPFSLTGAQQRVIDEILADLRSAAPMNRLVQGDVGSGKTVVGVAALLAAIQSGWQGAFMAPTEVLAEQHYRKLVDWLAQLHIPVELLTGSTGTAKRREIWRQLKTGELPVLVGTHALIQERVQFQRLGLIIIDEQHRFGVNQRAALAAKGLNPDVLTMTATPIPRTLTLTIHGDLDVSQIDELPPGRQPIHTAVHTPRERTQVYDLMRREIAQGRQAYVILPLIEDSEKLDLRSAMAEHEHLQTKVFPNLRVALLHGRMNAADKDAVLLAFRDREYDILVSTTVIEVGVDVPNASVMVIEHAERFGLSQLHQLRGRVGRGTAQSYCILMTPSKAGDASQRLGVLEQSRDGFFIAEMDLRLRGPGEVLGTRQSGQPDFILANIIHDQDVLELARQAAEQVIAADPELTQFPQRHRPSLN